MIDDTIQELTKILIKQDLEDKNNNSIKMVNMSKVDLIKLNLKVLKLIKNVYKI